MSRANRRRRNRATGRSARRGQAEVISAIEDGIAAEKAARLAMKKMREAEAVGLRMKGSP